MPRALLSVSDKTGIVNVARGLVSRGFELVSTGGTARTLAAAGLNVTGVSDLTGFPEMMDGRVKTLHPALHGGILARRDRPEDLAALERHGLGLVDVVIVNLYPFVKAAANPETSFDALVEEIDIGGPSLVRAAAKNFRGVLVVVDPEDYPRLIEALDGTPSLAFRYELMRKALAHTGAYDTAISATLATIDLDDDTFVRRGGDGTLGDRLTWSLEKIRDLRYGENPHQRAAWYRSSVLQRSALADGLGGATILQGKELSYTNLLDLDAAARIALEFDEPAAAVIKHTNPCGAAIGQSAADAYVRARDADSLAAFGGIVAINRPLDRAAAEAIVSTFIEAVVVPAVEPDARPILAGKANMRVVIADFERLRGGGLEVRSILGAALVQERDVVAEARTAWQGSEPDGLRVVTRRQPSAEEWGALRFAWRVCAHVKSNTVIFTNATQTLAIGAGQMSRVDAVEVAIMKARQRGERTLQNSVAASDAFFPFRDGLDAVARAGATAVVQPGGSVRDAEVIAAADEHGLAMVVTGRRHFRH
ncbi:MAG TPA: bifunctional phosphoribosylaminoimidazolecarboxamide formyltransferase/IMP cyclohydrolase [Vicinamibacterales bacterium]|jgi:phosphoribosylaminoimidazolecarboxamide formyltransferase/IMP cyclohydrolase|nr:bifunctional phosphoribosylaminoimidazolecarboxamide formyltransferase/IMP cyclohydrolase [Vicinamibacterales bacterium]